MEFCSLNSEAIFMSTDDQSPPIQPHSQAADDGVDIELSDEALRNYTGWFDVLIQMDLAQKIRNEQKGNDEKDVLQDGASRPTPSH
jgi:hypothetical protein